MALMLRKACQPILNDFDLDAFHADLNANTKSMQLFTPCGKLFATVAGVQFGGLNPTKAEIEFATELLADWLKRNTATIQEYLKEFEFLQRMPEYCFSSEGISVSCHTAWVEAEQRKVTGVRYVMITEEFVEFTVDNQGYITKTLVLEKFPATNTTALILPPARYQKAMELLKAVISRSDQERFVEHMVSILNTCDT